MNTWKSILSKFDGPADLMASIGCEYQAARKMLSRESVAPRHWPRLLDALNSRGADVKMRDLQMLRPELYPHLCEASV